MNLESVVNRFGLHAQPEQLPGGTSPTFRVENTVLKRVKETSLENNHSPELMEWIAKFSHEIKQEGFRFPLARKTTEGLWITDDGWTGWSVVDGVHATKADIPSCIEAINAFHLALRDIPKHPLMENNHTEWGLADRACWDEKPSDIKPEVTSLVEVLYKLRTPVYGIQKEQLIHGDLNPENILIAPNLPPAFIDFSPFWRPPEFALGMFANWIGPRQGDISVLQHFQDVHEFDQMLIRASIRMLLIMQNLANWEASSEKKAAELVIDYIQNK